MSSFNSTPFFGEINDFLKNSKDFKFYRIGLELGHGKYGTVHELYNIKSGYFHKYVIKIIDLKDASTSKISKIKKEFAVGQIKNIDKVGVKSYILHISNNIAWYVMDNINNKNYYNIPLFDYLLMLYDSKGKINKKVIKMFAKKMKMFYKITNGFHGDLHFTNINVILRKKYSVKESDLLDLKIIDYGTHQFFNNETKKLINKLNIKSPLKNYLNIIPNTKLNLNNQLISQNKDMIIHEFNKFKVDNILNI